MSQHPRTLWVLTAGPLAALTLCLFGPSTGLAKPVVSELRVEAAGQALAPGHSYVNDTQAITTDASPACGGSGAVVTVAGPTALGIVNRATTVEPDLRPFRVSDKFSFGLFVCGVGAFTGTESSFWSYKVDHVAPEVGGDAFKLEGGEEVLWYFSETGGANSGDELELRVPARVRPGRTFVVRAFSYDGTGRRSAAAGATIAIGSNEAVTNREGRATLGAGRRSLTLRARRGNDIPSEQVTVCVSKRRSACPARRGERIEGRSVADPIQGTAGADVVLARAGDDRIDVAGGLADRVLCGAGSDTVRVDRRDRAGRDCERVISAGSDV